MNRKKKLRFVLVVVGMGLLMQGCHTGNESGTQVTEHVVTNKKTNEKSEKPSFSYINKKGTTLKTRIRTPEGYSRTKVEKNSLGAFLRGYEMKPDGSPVLLYNGKKKR